MNSAVLVMASSNTSASWPMNSLSAVTAMRDALFPDDDPQAQRNLLTDNIKGVRFFVIQKGVLHGVKQSALQEKFGESKLPCP